MRFYLLRFACLVYVYISSSYGITQLGALRRPKTLTFGLSGQGVMLRVHIATF